MLKLAEIGGRHPHHTRRQGRRFCLSSDVFGRVSEGSGPFWASGGLLVATAGFPFELLVITHPSRCLGADFSREGHLSSIFDLRVFSP